MRYFRLPGMTRRKALSLWWFNNVKRHWHNWRYRRMWRADPTRPSICPQAGAISPACWAWATEQAKQIEATDRGISREEFKRRYAPKREE